MNDTVVIYDRIEKSSKFNRININEISDIQLMRHYQEL